VGLAEAIRGVFSFLSSTSRNEQRMADYVVREHRRGRTLEDILQDKYVTNRCTPEQIRRLLDRPEVVHAIGDDVVAAARATV
jgi:hypothetical protein